MEAGGFRDRWDGMCDGLSGTDADPGIHPTHSKKYFAELFSDEEMGGWMSGWMGGDGQR